MTALNCTNCTILASSLSDYKHKCSKLLSIILNELEDATKAIPLSNVYLEQFLEKIRDDLTDVMVGMVNRKLENQIENLDFENETLRRNVSELERKIHDLENKNDFFADLVDTERTAEQENKSLKRKLSKIQMELEQVSNKRQKRCPEKRVKIPEATEILQNSKNSANPKNSEKSKILGQKSDSDKKLKLIPLPIGCNLSIKLPKKVTRGTCTTDDKQPYKVLNYKPVPTISLSSSSNSSSSRYGFGKTPNSLKEKTNIMEPKKRLQHLCNL